jgi:hypothetical protein
MVYDKYPSLLHQFQPKFLRLLQTERKIDIVKDTILQLDRKPCCLLIFLRPRQVPSPLLLLAGNMCSAGHFNIGVDEEECDDLAMPRLGWNGPTQC